MDLEMIILSMSDKDKYCVFTYIQSLKKKSIKADSWVQISGYQMGKGWQEGHDGGRGTNSSV